MKHVCEIVLTLMMMVLFMAVVPEVELSPMMLLGLMLLVVPTMALAKFLAWLLVGGDR